MQRWGGVEDEKEKVMDEIAEFNGAYRFLSNFYPAEVEMAGRKYPSVENAYQAAKRPRPEQRTVFESCSPSAAKQLGRTGPVRLGWDKMKEDVMRMLLSRKFRPGSVLARRMMDTGSAELIEGNTWGDRFWGVCGGSGENRLGKLLMEQRRFLQASTPAS